MSFDNIPRTKAEMLAFIREKRLTMYSVSTDLGLNQEERCKTKSTPVEILRTDSPTPEPDATPSPLRSIEVDVTVNADGGVSAAHIATSSGSVERDAAALSLAYHATYTAATKKCIALEATRRFAF